MPPPSSRRPKSAAFHRAPACFCAAALLAPAALPACNCGTEDLATRPETALSASVPSASIAPAPSSATPEESAAPVASRVVLITVDALRSDQPWTTYPAASTPNLSALAKSGVVYERAWSLANTTGPSLGALLASRYPTEMGRDDCPLAGLDVTNGLAQTLSENGVWTGAAHGHPYFGGGGAPRVGFESWRTIPQVLGRRAVDGAVTGEDVATLAIEMFSSAPSDRPAFLWAHFVDPHDKYVLQPGFPASGNAGRSIYDSEVAYTDFHIGRLFRAIEASPFAASTAILVTADHGEAFGEHGTWRHGMNMYDEETRVPLLWRAPGHKPATISVPRSLIDVAPTIADMLGVQPPPSWRGKSLLKDATSPHPEERPVIVDAPDLMSSPPRRAVVMGNLKVIVSDGQQRAFDLAADPQERKPLARDAASEPIARATKLLEQIPAVPSRRCPRQAYRVAP